MKLGRIMKTFTGIVLILTTALSAQGRIMRTWSYQELYHQADLVVIAKPVSTQETAEKATLPDVAPISTWLDYPRSSRSVW
jgi:hypothetical protein